jgi:hypothetical protein
MFCGTVLSSSYDEVSLEAGRKWTTVLTWKNLDWKEDYIEEIGVKE